MRPLFAVLLLLLSILKGNGSFINLISLQYLFLCSFFPEKKKNLLIPNFYRNYSRCRCRSHDSCVAVSQKWNFVYSKSSLVILRFIRKFIITAKIFFPRVLLPPMEVKPTGFIPASEYLFGSFTVSCFLCLCLWHQFFWFFHFEICS